MDRGDGAGVSRGRGTGGRRGRDDRRERVRIDLRANAGGGAHPRQDADDLRERSSTGALERERPGSRVGVAAGALAGGRPDRPIPGLDEGARRRDRCAGWLGPWTDDDQRPRGRNESDHDRLCRRGQLGRERGLDPAAEPSRDPAGEPNQQRRGADHERPRRVPGRAAEILPDGYPDVRPGGAERQRPGRRPGSSPAAHRLPFDVRADRRRGRRRGRGPELRSGRAAGAPEARGRPGVPARRHQLHVVGQGRGPSRRSAC